MANNFNDDARIIDYWRFENNTNAGKAGNNLSVSGAPAYHSVTPLEGAYSIDLEAATHDIAYRTDANLSAEFPLKSGDAIKKISVAFWVRPESVSGSGGIFTKWSTTLGRTFAIYRSGADLVVSIGYNGGASGENWIVVSALFVAGRDYHIGVAIDGVNKNALLRVWDAYNSTATTYTHTFTNEMYIGTADLVIGTLTTNYYDGLVDELPVANDLFSADEFDAIRQGLFGAPEDIEVNLGLALLDVVPLSVAGQVTRIRQYPITPGARGYGLQNKRVFPNVR